MKITRTITFVLNEDGSHGFPRCRACGGKIKNANHWEIHDVSSDTLPSEDVYYVCDFPICWDSDRHQMIPFDPAR